MGQAMAAFDRTKTMAPPPLCPKCGCEDESMMEVVNESRSAELQLGHRSAELQLGHRSAELQLGPSRSESPDSRTYYCNICSNEWTVALQPVGRFPSIEALVQRTGLRRDELTTLADIGALNAFTSERRSALWQVERAVRPAGDLFESMVTHIPTPNDPNVEPAFASGFGAAGCARSPLSPMSPAERLHADCATNWTSLLTRAQTSAMARLAARSSSFGS
jgi:hypothetical protein